MPGKDNEQLNAFVENHLKRIKQVVDDPFKELTVLQAVVIPEKLPLPKVMSLSEVGDYALDLRGANNTTYRLVTPISKEGQKRQELDGSPVSVNYDFDNLLDRQSPTVIEQKVDERIAELKEAGVSSSPLPEVNSTTIGGFVSDMTNYIVRTVVALPSAAAPAVKVMREPNKYIGYMVPPKTNRTKFPQGSGERVIII